jgi:hypothetical protein
MCRLINLSHLSDNYEKTKTKKLLVVEMLTTQTLSCGHMVKYACIRHYD